MRKCFQRNSKIIFWKEYRKLECLRCAMCQSFHICWIWSARVGSLSSLRPCDQGTSASSSSSTVQSLVHTNRIPLFYKKILARIMLSIRNKNITIVHFLLSSCDMSLHGKLVAIASRWLLKLFFLKSNDVLDAVLGTDLGEQRCFKFLIRQFVSF